MHLTLYNFSKNPLQCVVEWFLTTTTSFYGEDLHLPVMFGVFCWNYSIGGLVMLYIKPQWVSQSQFPYTLFCVLLILVQAPLSFLADYCHMTKDSTWHVYDRLMACISMTLQIWKIVELWRHHTRIPFLVLYSLLLVLAVTCFGQSQAAQLSQDQEQFVLWHNLWHLYPLAAAVLTTHDHFVHGRTDLEIKQKLPPLLSSLAMTAGDKKTL